MTDATLRTAISNAIGYWELRRLIYNSALALVVVIIYSLNLPGSRSAIGFNEVEVLVVMAVLANVAYCAAYFPDVLMQMSRFRDKWIKIRWLLLLVGVIFAAIITNFFAEGMFGHSA